MVGQESEIKLRELCDETAYVLRHAGKTQAVEAVSNAPTPGKLIAEINKAILRDRIQGHDRGDLESIKAFAHILAKSW